VETRLLGLTAQIVSAYVANHDVATQHISQFICNVHSALFAVVQSPVEPTKLQPASDAEKSVSADHILCLDCGRSFKALRNHIRAEHQMTPAQYRIKWNLPASFPMVAAEAAARRSKMAKTSELGRKVGRGIRGRR
jgi:predicted transcriptional regulator